MTISLTLAAALTAAGAIVHGRYINRWGLPSELPLAAEKLHGIPESFGPWRMDKAEPMDGSTARMLQCAGYINREYEHGESGQRVNMAVIVGPPGPTSMHIPEICFSSKQYEIKGRTERFTIARPNGREDAFRAVTFRSLNPAVGLMRVVYAWNGEGQWVAPDRPRLSLRAHQALYKIQVAAPLPAGADPQDHDPCREFIQDLLPVLDAAMIGDGRKAPARG